MGVYCYRCGGCERKFEHSHRLHDGAMHVRDDGEVCGPAVRDYKAEAVGVDTSNLRSAR